MVGAFERLPARDEIPTNKNERPAPKSAAMVAWKNEIPKPRKNAP
jgi:hypothetical protein